MNANIFQQAYDYLKPQLEGPLLLNEPLFKYTTLRIGGNAALYAQADSLSDLKTLLSYSADNGLGYLIIGRGANLLISDKGFSGLVIHLGRDFNHLKVDSSKAIITAGAAVSLARVLQEAYTHSLEGLSFAAGIPATVGGAITSNAGAFGSNIGELILNLNVLKNGNLMHYERPFKTAYRKGPLAGDEVLIEAVFRLKPGEKIIIKAQTERFFKQRKQAQPLNYPNAGSIFKNPSTELSAGELIDKCGLKGKSCGGAMISEQHANFIVNKDNAKAADVYTLLNLARQTVEAEHGVLLEPEIKLIGEFSGQ